MAAPAFGAIGTQLQGSGSSMNVAAPSGVAVGNVLVVVAFIDTAGATVTGMPAGWANTPDSPVTGPDNHKMYVMYKVADSGDTGASTFNFTLSASVYRNAACTRYTGADTSSPWDVTNGVGSNNSQTTTEDVADTTTVADTLLVWGGTNWSGGSWTPPSGFTERRDTGDGVCTSADKTQAVAGSTGSIVGTCTGSDKRCAWVGALKPASSGTSVNAPAVTAAGTAPTATAALSTRPVAPVGAATAPQATAALTVRPTAPVAAATAPQPTVNTGSNTNAPAGATTAAGTAPAPAVRVAPNPGAPVGAATAPQPTITITVRPVAPVGAATAPAAAGTGGRQAPAPAPTAAASAPQPTIRITARPAAVTVTVTAPQPGSDQHVPLQLRVLPLYSTRTFGADGYRAGENQTVWLPTRLDPGAPLLVVCHGTAAQASWYNDSPDRYRPLEAIANTGIVVIAGDLGEPANADGWGNDLSVARVWEVTDWAADEFGCNTTRIHLRGESAGGATALNAARDRPEQTASVHLAAGVCDIEAIYQGGAGNSILVALIDLAYTTGGGWPAQRATHDPALNTAELAPMADRIRLYYTSGDGLVPPQATIDFAADVGCELVPVGEMPHSDEVLTSIQPGDLAAWMWSLT